MQKPPDYRPGAFELFPFLCRRMEPELHPVHLFWKASAGVIWHRKGKSFVLRIRKNTAILYFELV
jgi:hypothetical protein